jgi:hypothetical protein
LKQTECRLFSPKKSRRFLEAAHLSLAVLSPGAVIACPRPIILSRSQERRATKTKRRSRPGVVGRAVSGA